MLRLKGWGCRDAGAIYNPVRDHDVGGRFIIPCAIYNPVRDVQRILRIWQRTSDPKVKRSAYKRSRAELFRGCC
jgi:hypothetical protein